MVYFFWYGSTTFQLFVFLRRIGLGGKSLEASWSKRRVAGSKYTEANIAEGQSLKCLNYNIEC